MQLGSLKEGQRFKTSKKGATWKVTYTHPYMGWFSSGSVHAENESTGTTRRYTTNHKSWEKQVILVE